jgi:hypothetical protein
MNFEQNVQTLMNMGIPEAYAKYALKQTNNDPNLAVQLIVEMLQSPSKKKIKPPPETDEGKSIFIEQEFINKKRSFLLLKWDPNADETISYEDFKKYSNKKCIERHDLILKTIPNFIPDENKGEYYKIEDFGYKFNEKGELRCIVEGLEDEKFIFVSEKHYDALGEAIIRYIQQDLMVKECELEEVFLDEETKLNNIFLSKDALTNTDKLLVLVQGSGPVRAGMWARSLCFNDSLSTGACIEYIKQAQKEGYGIIVLNPNLNGS